MLIKDVTDLDIYNESFKLLNNLYNLLKRVPKTKYDTIIQFKKCGKSIPANIAEGWAKRSSALEFKRFLKISLGSSDELITHLRTLIITAPYLSVESQALIESYKVLSKRINALH